MKRVQQIKKKTKQNKKNTKYFFHFENEKEGHEKSTENL